VHYHPQAAGEEEFIELMNISPTNPVDLGGCAFTSGIDYVFAPDTVIGPGVRLVLRASQFLNGTALANGGERLRFEAPGGVIIKDFEYDDAPPWPSAADGQGPSLVLIAPDENPDHSNPFNWRSSTAAGGNPGADDSAPLTGDLLDYALGPGPQTAFAMTPDGMAFVVSRVPNADHAEIIGEAGRALNDWQPVPLVAATATTLTFLIPADLDAGRQVFTRVRVRAR
jgi:hypothetical protein